MKQPNRSARWTIVDFDDIPPVPCPCGKSRRALADVASFPGTIHRTEISTEARAHYHRRLTEVYYFLECDAEARIELDGELVPIKPAMCVVIPPGVRHRAVGQMTVLIIVHPKFDPDDEWFD
ncbi:MAG: cupin domain-containing protein [Planctomycetes bacterium]|nr:cupin domain-containing protein [Planctomycetota bacterium]